MKERGLICKDDEVSAILDGRKTVMRRPVTSMNGFGRITRVSEGSRGYSVACTDTKGVVHDIAYHEACDRGPFGVPGDRLWVRERFAPVDSNGHKCAVRDANFVVMSDGAQVCRDGTVVDALPKFAQGVFDGIIWRPSIHMPRWASRILLEVVSVRVERLHAITEEDARREGMGGKGLTASEVIDRAAGLPRAASFRAAFENKWRSFNYTKRHAWSENPFVWRVEFRRLP